MTGSVQVSNGKWYCVLNMKDENGKRKQKWISTGLSEKGNKKKAQKILDQLKLKYDGHDIIANAAQIPFEEYCRKWLESRRISLEISTYEGYEIRIRHIEKYFRPLKLPLAKVTSRHIKNFYDYLITNGNMAKYKKEPGLSERTVKEIALLVKAVFKEAVLLGDVVKNPAEQVAVPKKRKTCAEADIYIDEEDMKNLFREIQGHPLEELIITTLYFGLRRSEVLGLRWSAVDFNKNMLTINHTVVKVKSTVRKDNTKTEDSLRKCYMSEYIANMLRKVRRRQLESKVLFGQAYFESDYIFTWQNGKPFSPDYVTKTFKKIVTRSENLPTELTFHDLRKSCISILVEDGYSVKDIQKWVGHKDTRTTLNIYAKVKDSKMSKISHGLEEKFKVAG